MFEGGADVWNSVTVWVIVDEADGKLVAVFVRVEVAKGLKAVRVVVTESNRVL